MRRPNILVVVFDDLGFSDFGCYGSSMETPTVDSLAASGHQFTNFTATPLCSPTRAALLTGRNQHSVGMGSIVQFAGTEPGYTGVIPDSARMLPRLLRDVGYATFAVGKWHLTPSHEGGPSGRFSHWPLGQGFERFYGFLPGKTDHWRPEIAIGNEISGPPTDLDGYHLSSDLADQTIRFIADHLGGRPQDPFFGYLSFGAVHSPHHAPQDYIDRYRGSYDHGWDAEMQQRFGRQIQRGLFTQSVQRAPRNPDVPAWDELPAEEQRVSARFMEAFAGFLTHADHQLGKVIDFLDRTGVRDETIVIVLSDNGATDAGRVYGALNEERLLNRFEESRKDRVESADAIGSSKTLNQYPNGWGQASNTPFRWYKHTVHNGGIRCPMVIDWPSAMRSSGRMVADHVHVTDVVPTLLEATRTSPPKYIDGTEQLPLHGESFLSSLIQDRGFTRRQPQYFEVKGHRALIDGNWKAVARHDPGTSYDEDMWELIDLTNDPAEVSDQSRSQRERVEAMVETWWKQASLYQVLPMDDRGVERLLDPENMRVNNREWSFRPEMTPVPAEAAPHLAGRSFRIDARVSLASNDSGVLLAAGGQFSGFSLFAVHEELVFHYNAAGTRNEVRLSLPHGNAVNRAVATFEIHGDQAIMSLGFGDDPEARRPSSFLPLRMSVETMQCGRDLGTPVSPEYETPFEFTGAIDVVHLSVLS